MCVFLLEAHLPLSISLSRWNTFFLFFSLYPPILFSVFYLHLFLPLLVALHTTARLPLRCLSLTALFAPGDSQKSILAGSSCVCSCMFVPDSRIYVYILSLLRAQRKTSQRNRSTAHPAPSSLSTSRFPFVAHTGHTRQQPLVSVTRSISPSPPLLYTFHRSTRVSSFPPLAWLFTYTQVVYIYRQKREISKPLSGSRRFINARVDINLVKCTRCVG